MDELILVKLLVHGFRELKFNNELIFTKPKILCNLEQYFWLCYAWEYLLFFGIHRCGKDGLVILEAASWLFSFFSICYLSRETFKTL